MSARHPPIAAPLGDVTSPRLLLRRFGRGDLDELSVVFAQPEVWEFPYGRALTRAETEGYLDAQMKHWENCGFGCWAARARETGRLIGYVGLSVPTFLPEILPAVEVGWRIMRTAWGNGYATEGATAALDEAFTTLRLDRVCSLPQVDNPRSVKVAARLGMRLVRNVHVPANDRRGAVTAALYEIDAGEWLSRRSDHARS